jgi:hypothetical protein
MKVENWNRTAACHPSRVVDPTNLDHLVRIVENQDVEQSPTPVRAVGSLHSLNPCFTTTGTLVRMKSPEFRRIQDPKDGRVTVGAGVTMFELKEALKPHGLQIAVTPEIGNATAGSVACCGTKDASLGSGPGQICSCVVGARIVDASGTDRAVTPAELPAFRSSYGLLGVVHEVTFETCPLQQVRYAAESLPLAGLTFPRALASADGFLGFLFPDHRTMVVERRTLVPGARPQFIPDHVNLLARTKIWKKGGFPFVLDPPAFDVEFNVGFPLLSFVADRVDAMIDFRQGGEHFFDFAFWAFPRRTWDTAIPAYVDFCHEFLGSTGFRPALPTEVYHMTRYDAALLSPSKGEDVFTLDMVHMVFPDRPDTQRDRDLWDQMNDDFNQRIALPFGARPLLNQTKRLTRSIVDTALGDDWKRFAGLRATADPTARFRSDFFTALGA